MKEKKVKRVRKPITEKVFPLPPGEYELEKVFPGAFWAIRLSDGLFKINKDGSIAKVGNRNIEDWQNVWLNCLCAVDPVTMKVLLKQNTPLELPADTEVYIHPPKIVMGSY